MNTQLLIEMLQLASINTDSISLAKGLSMLALQVSVDPELDDDITINSFDNEFYTENSISYIKKCFDFNI